MFQSRSPPASYTSNTSLITTPRASPAPPTLPTPRRATPMATKYVSFASSKRSELQKQPNSAGACDSDVSDAKRRLQQRKAEHLDSFLASQPRDVTQPVVSPAPAVTTLRSSAHALKAFKSPFRAPARTVTQNPALDDSA